MSEFFQHLAQAIINGGAVVGHAVGKFLYSVGHDWSLAWVPIVVVIVVGVGLWAMMLRKD